MTAVAGKEIKVVWTPGLVKGSEKVGVKLPVVRDVGRRGGVGGD
jgi:hypothetical protein